MPKHPAPATHRIGLLDAGGLQLGLDAHDGGLEVVAALLHGIDERLQILVVAFLLRFRLGVLGVRLLGGRPFLGDLEGDRAVLQLLKDFLVAHDVLHAAELALRRLVAATAGFHDRGDDLGAAELLGLDELDELDVVGLRLVDGLVILGDQGHEFLVGNGLGLGLGAGFGRRGGGRVGRGGGLGNGSVGWFGDRRHGIVWFGLVWFVDCWDLQRCNLVLGAISVSSQ